MKIIKSLYKINRLKSQKSPKIRDPYMEIIQKEKNVKKLRSVYGDNPLKIPLVSLQQDRIGNIASKKISLKMGSNIARVRKAIKNKYPGGVQSINDPFKKKQAQRMEIKAFKLADLSGKRLQQKLSDKTGIGIRRFGSKPTKKEFLSNEKSQELGFPGREESSYAKYQYAKSLDPNQQIKKLQKVIKQGGTYKRKIRDKMVLEKGKRTYKPDFQFKKLPKKDIGVLKNRLKSFEYEERINKAYSNNKFLSAKQPATFTSSLNKEARIQRMFKGKSFVKSKKKQSKKLSMYERRNIYKKQMASEDTFALRNYKKFNVLIPKK